MGNRTCDRIDDIVVDDQIDVGSVVGKGVVSREMEIGTCLPPAVHEPNHTARHLWVETSPERDGGHLGLDPHACLVVNALSGSVFWVNLSQGLGSLGS